MSHENVEIARRAYDAYNRRDIDAMLALATADCVMISQLLDASAEFRGRDGLVRYYAMLNESWEEFRSVIEEAHDLGDHVLTLNRSTARGKGSGMDVDAPTAAVFDFRDAQDLRASAYISTGPKRRGRRASPSSRQGSSAPAGAVRESTATDGRRAVPGAPRPRARAASRAACARQAFGLGVGVVGARAPSGDDRLKVGSAARSS